MHERTVKMPIRVTNARVHNLRGVCVEIPRDKIVVVTGPSGSGKSSLAYDTIYAEGQRQYIESLSVYARQFIHQIERPDVDSISGLQPTVSIDQRSGSTNPRSTVATLTDIHDFLRLLYARCGDAHCHICLRPIHCQSPEQILADILRQSDGTRLMLLAPIVRGHNGQHKDVLRKIVKSGFVRARIDGNLLDAEAVLTELESINATSRTFNNIEAVVDRVVIKPGINPRLAESLKLALEVGDGTVVVVREKERITNADGTTHSIWKDTLYSTKYACAKCNISFPELEPRSFSFNNPYGACPTCQGLGKCDRFNTDLLIPDPILSLSQGAVSVWKSLLPSTLKTYKTEIDTFFALPHVTESMRRSGVESDKITPMQLPICRFDETILNELLHGTIVETHNDSTTSETRGIASLRHSDNVTFTSNTVSTANITSTNNVPSNEPQPFIGIIGLLERTLQTTKSAKERTALTRCMNVVTCPDCGGSRLRAESREVKIGDKRLHEVCAMTVEESLAFFNDLKLNLPPEKSDVATIIIEQIVNRIDFLNRIGLGYLTLARPADTLSGGELQRVRLGTGLGNGLVGVCYVLDEPSIGLHPRDNQRLIDAMRFLQRQGNTVIVVEHDETIMRNADWLIDMGPSAGKRGGLITAEGTPSQIQSDTKSLTGKYLSGEMSIPVPSKRRRINKSRSIQIEGVTTNNLKNVTAAFPLGTFICVTGVSGSGKSSLINETLVPAMRRRLAVTNESIDVAKIQVGSYTALRGASKIDKLVQVDQTPIGRSPRSNPATYTGIYDEIRKVFALSKDAQRRGYKSGRFSFNIHGGRCEECLGHGVRKIEMHFLPEMYAVCPVCGGKRFNRQTLEVKYKDLSIADVLDLQVDDAVSFFENFPMITRVVECLQKVGLGYITLGQSATTFSGGEAQRIKLATELAKLETGNTLYVLDEPTSGLHSDDIKKLLEVLDDLVDKGNTVIVVEHNLEVIKTADHIIDLGPEGGDKGGEVTAVGTPEEIAALENNYTGKFLGMVLNTDRLIH
ncbi:MAG: excinuclease ABC subunit UvrA [Planctomycetaceae bacterium]|jgi:excinuclease ABC subunit A|nr:excinuclease ABC subunit UvrA [Planctomycetaceae bacterium]